MFQPQIFSDDIRSMFENGTAPFLSRLVSRNRTVQGDSLTPVQTFYVLIVIYGRGGGLVEGSSHMSESSWVSLILLINFFMRISLSEIRKCWSPSSEPFCNSKQFFHSHIFNGMGKYGAFYSFAVEIGIDACEQKTWLSLLTKIVRPTSKDSWPVLLSSHQVQIWTVSWEELKLTLRYVPPLPSPQIKYSN